MTQLNHNLDFISLMLALLNLLIIKFSHIISI